ncbi:thiF family domain-containing protein [Ditylenchus destructor]|nr:thiF family domain-containing protein [Ditylenchus destructor]
MTRPGGSSIRPSNAPSTEISQAEAEVYDRQIRLWGLDAQNRLRNSSVLLVGLSGLGAEVAKNLMLSGLKMLTIMDTQEVTTNDLCSNFLVSNESIGNNRAEASRQRTQVLNPMVELVILPDSLEKKSNDFFRAFDLVILIDQKYSLVNKVNTICRKLGIRFQAGSVFGWIGYAFADFNNHEFLLPKPKVADYSTLDDDDDDMVSGSGDEPATKKQKINGGNGAHTVATVTLEDESEQKIRQKVAFSSFDQTFNVDWSSKRASRRTKSLIPQTYFQVKALLELLDKDEHITIETLVFKYKEILQQAGRDDSNINSDEISYLLDPQLNPVCAIVGSIIGQEAIKAISQNDPPLKNAFFYSALDTSGIVCDLPPKP